MTDDTGHVTIVDGNHATSFSADSLDGETVVVETDENRISVPTGFGVAYHENRGDGAEGHKPDLSVGSEGTFPGPELARMAMVLGGIALVSGGWLFSQFSNGTGLVMVASGAALGAMGARESFARYTPKFGGGE